MRSGKRRSLGTSPTRSRLLFLGQEVEVELSFVAEFAVVSLAVGSFVGAGTADDRFVGGAADVHPGAVAGGGNDLAAGEAEDEGALLVAAVELCADARVASDRLAVLEELPLT